MTMWRKSSRSGTTEGDTSCIEVAGLVGPVVGVRDSKDPEGGRLYLTPREWAALVARIKDGWAG